MQIENYCFFCWSLLKDIATPTINATTVIPCATIRALIISWDVRRLPCRKLQRPYDKTPAVVKQPAILGVLFQYFKNIFFSFHFDGKSLAEQ